MHDLGRCVLVPWAPGPCPVTPGPEAQATLNSRLLLEWCFAQGDLEEVRNSSIKDHMAGGQQQTRTDQCAGANRHVIVEIRLSRGHATARCHHAHRKDTQQRGKRAGCFGDRGDIGYSIDLGRLTRSHRIGNADK